MADHRYLLPILIGERPSTQLFRDLGVHDHLHQVRTPGAHGALESRPQVLGPLHRLALDPETPRYLNDVDPVYVEARHPISGPDRIPETLEDRVSAVVDDDESDLDPVVRGGPERLDRVHARPVSYDARHRPLRDRELEPDGGGHREPEAAGARDVIAAGMVDADVSVELGLAGDRLVEDRRPFGQDLGEGVHHVLDGYRVAGLGHRRLLRGRWHGPVGLRQDLLEGPDRRPHVSHDAAPGRSPGRLFGVFGYLHHPRAFFDDGSWYIRVVEK